MNATLTDAPRIYVASLSDYNAGILHGAWIDADQDADTIQDAIAAMLADSPATKQYGELAEEWAIHDYDNMPNLGEWPSLLTIATTAQGISEHGDAYRAWIDNNCGNDIEVSNFTDQYLGEYGSLEDYAREYVEFTGMFDGVNESITNYFDYEAFAHDLSFELTELPAPNGNVYIFDPNR